MTIRDFTPNIEWVRTDLITPYSGNTKLHPREQIEKLAKSIKELGFEVPLSLTGDGEIITGHGRYLAAQLLKLDKIPVIYRKDLTPEEVKVRRIVDNSLAVSGYDDLVMRRELDDLRELNVDLTRFGASEAELLKLSSEIDEKLNKLKNKDHGEGKSVADSEIQLILTIKFADEVSMKECYEEFIERGLEVKIFN